MISTSLPSIQRYSALLGFRLMGIGYEHFESYDGRWGVLRWGHGARDSFLDPVAEAGGDSWWKRSVGPNLVVPYGTMARLDIPNA